MEWSPSVGTAGSREPLSPGTQVPVCLPQQLFLLRTLLPHRVEQPVPHQGSWPTFPSCWGSPGRKVLTKGRGSKGGAWPNGQTDWVPAWAPLTNHRTAFGRSRDLPGSPVPPLQEPFPSPLVATQSCLWRGLADTDWFLLIPLVPWVQSPAPETLVPLPSLPQSTAAP